MSEAAPCRVSRVGGTVRTFEERKTLWKKAHVSDQGCLVQMELPVGARLVYPQKPSHPWNANKLRAEVVDVVSLEAFDGSSLDATVAEAPHVDGFYYRVGERAAPHTFDDDVTTVDAAGIHCYATREGARFWGDESYSIEENGDLDE